MGYLTLQGRWRVEGLLTCVFYVRSLGTAWERTQVVDCDNCGRYKSIALDENDMPHIIYYDRNERLLKYARLTDDEEWEIETIDGDTAWTPSSNMP